MTNIFLVQHLHELEDHEEIKIIGIYSSEKEAKDAIERSKKLDGFDRSISGFSVDSYALNQDHWIDGFFTVD